MTKLKQPITRTVCILIGIALLSGCATHAAGAITARGPGFFLGFWHGLIAPVTFLPHLVSGVAIDATPNDGDWYDCGFLLGMGAFFTVASCAATRRQRHKN
jgi:hypothetical protein